MIDTMLMVAKSPQPGRVKTRLVPPLTFEQAAALARAALADSLRAASELDAPQQVIALDGAAGSWLPPRWRCVAQSGGGLDERIAAAFAHASGPAVLIGMDTPQLRPDQLAAFDPTRYDACLGLAADGGYWALGLAEPLRATEVVTGVPMSRATTGAEQLRRLHEHGLRVQMLDVLEDVDTFAAALRVATIDPRGAFAQAVGALGFDGASNGIGRAAVPHAGEQR